MRRWRFGFIIAFTDGHRLQRERFPGHFKGGFENFGIPVADVPCVDAIIIGGRHSDCLGGLVYLSDINHRWVVIPDNRKITSKRIEYAVTIFSRVKVQILKSFVTGVVEVNRHLA